MQVISKLPATSGIKHVGIWVRVSTQDQAEGDSPEHHEQRARFYAEAKGWHVTTVYHLEAVSGKSVMGHPETERMLNDIREGRTTGIIFSKLARLARNTKELLDIADIFKDCGADLISLAESIDTSSPAGRMFFTVQAALTQFEREEIAERVAASVPIRAKLGKSLGGVAPFGYQWQDKKLVLDPEEAPVRRLIYDLYIEHRRKKTVARLLNQAGYRTRSGAHFSDTTVDRLLRDPIAKGSRRANYTKSTGDKKRWTLKPEDEWIYIDVPPLISAEVWRQCNDLLDAQKQQPRFSARKTVQLFAGLAFCSCGSKLYVPSNTPKYVCFTCRNKIAVTDLEATYREQLKEFFLSPKEMIEYVERADDVLRDKQAVIETLKRKERKLKSDMDKLMRLYLDERLSAEGLGAQYKPLEEQAKEVERQIPKLEGEVEGLKAQLMSSGQVLSNGKSLYLSWDDLEQDEKRQIVESTVEKIVVGERDITIELDYFPTSSEPVAKGQRANTGSSRRRA